MRSRKRTKSKNKIRRAIIISLLTLIIGLSSTAYFVKAQMEDMVFDDTFYSGIVVEGIDLSGMTLAEAEAVISEKLNRHYEEYHVLVRYNNREWEFDHRDLNITSDYREVLKKAYSIAREGTLFERYTAIKALRENEISYDISISYTIEGLYDQLVSITNEIAKEPVNATIAFFPTRTQKFEITEEQHGLSLDLEQVVNDIRQGLELNKSIEVDLEPTPVYPTVTAADLEQQTSKITVFHTGVSGSADRKHNVYHAASKFDGMIIQPGETISFNETTGQRTIANGFRMAPVIMPDKSLQDDLGGGVCQTSTTLYNAVVQAGLKIEERFHHSFPVSYVKIGHDAMVDWPRADLKFTNTGETPVYLHTYRNGESLYVEVYGKVLEDVDHIKLETDIYEQYKAPQPRIIEDIHQEYVTYTDQRHTTVESRAGYKAKTYRVYYREGQEVQRELMSDDYYRPVTGTVYVGTRSRVEEEPATDTTGQENVDITRDEE